MAFFSSLGGVLIGALIAAVYFLFIKRGTRTLSKANKVNAIGMALGGMFARLTAVGFIFLFISRHISESFPAMAISFVTVFSMTLCMELGLLLRQKMSRRNTV